MTWLIFFGAWFVVSIPAALIVGRLLSDSDDNR